jgi:hypothetical protein
MIHYGIYRIRRYWYLTKVIISSNDSVKEIEKTSKQNSYASDSISETCFIETLDSENLFENLQSDEIELNIRSRRNKIFLLLDEVRRLKIQQKLEKTDIDFNSGKFSVGKENFKSALPFMPPITEKTFKNYSFFFASTVTLIIIFGGLVAPILEVKLGLGGKSYQDFIKSIGLPGQLAEVDPIVASFCGGAVGVLSALFIVEANNINTHAIERCFYCQGTGYLSCGKCNGNRLQIEKKYIKHERCRNCSGTGKVMCTSCLCTGKQLVTEHDPRLNPWN